MKYAIQIDWLSIHCHYKPLDHTKAEWQPDETDENDLFGRFPWRYKLAEYGTRQFSRLFFVRMPNPEGGLDDFAEIQASPHSGILNRASVIVRFVNRALYLPDFWELAGKLLSDNEFEFKGITRIDLCADFNDFAEISPLALIEGFAAKKLRHIGRGVGALYFNHGVMLDRITGNREYSVKYNGLSFGTHTSDCRVYLYNKSFELLTQGDKPWIRDTWKAIGLDERNVWRLEVSIKSKGCTFRDKETGDKITINLDNSREKSGVTKVYNTFVRKLFSFIRLPMSQKNITREPRILLFDGLPSYDRGVIRNISASNRLDRMIIKALYFLGDTYRGGSSYETADLAQSFAVNIAESTDLSEWMARKLPEWEKPIHR